MLKKRLLGNSINSHNRFVNETNKYFHRLGLHCSYKVSTCFLDLTFTMISQNQCFTDVDASLWSPDPKSLSNSGKLPSEYSHLLPQSDYMKPQNIFLENSCLDSIKCGGKFEDFFFMGPELGRGQFGVVNLVIERRTGNKLACKLLDKRRIKTE